MTKNTHDLYFPFVFKDLIVFEPACGSIHRYFLNQLAEYFSTRFHTRGLVRKTVSGREGAHYTR